MPLTPLLCLLVLAAPPKGMTRERVRAGATPPAKAETTVNVVHLHTKEVLVMPVRGKFKPSPEVLSRFLRCRFSDQERPMDPRLGDLMSAVAAQFGQPELWVVSGYRAPRFNTMLRKKLGEVARNSLHTRGEALDVIVPGADLGLVSKFLRKLKKGGVGYYPGSEFVHMDVGPVRFWEGN
ncbi:DUF882 domain-containing protein [Myxococcota bacterium]|nr:DUF882 domain-containing protein [Myxococcota bacterium]MBU1413358.1 DUF882 domain-containing protein [Myxococcota bacterium]MBU1510061.1 DUF882 domain-containing protein [Myxococcota bacterium]